MDALVDASAVAAPLGKKDDSTGKPGRILQAARERDNSHRLANWEPRVVREGR